MLNKNLLNDAVICKEEETVYEIAVVLKETFRKHLVVVDSDGKPKGIVSQSDIVNNVVAMNRDANKVKVEDIMNNKILVVDIEKDDCEDAMKKMINIGIFSLPAVKNGKIVGMLNIKELIDSKGGVKNESC